MSDRGQLQSLIMNDAYDYVNEADEDGFEANIEQPVIALLCKLLGHQIEDDQCNIPEHRYCVWCSKRETAIKEES